MFFSATALILANVQAMAESQALRNRGASCTSYCTIGGKSVTTDLDLAGLGRADIDVTTNSETLRKKINLINAQCRVLTEGEMKDSANAMNYHWCETNCMEKGGLYSKLNNRQDKVKAFIEKRKEFCKKTLKTYEELFKQRLKYDNSKHMLVMLP